MPKKSGVKPPFELHPKTDRAYKVLKGVKSKGGGFGFILMRLVRDQLVVSAVENDRGGEEGDHHVHDFIDEMAMQNALLLGILKWQGRLVLTEYIPKGTAKAEITQLRKAKKWFLKEHPGEIYHSEGTIKGPSPGKKLPKKKLTQELKTHAMMVDSVETRDILVSEAELVAADATKRSAGDLDRYAEMASRDEDLKKILLDDTDSKEDTVVDPVVGGDMIASAPNQSEMPVKSAASAESTSDAPAVSEDAAPAESAAEEEEKEAESPEADPSVDPDSAKGADEEPAAAADTVEEAPSDAKEEESAADGTTAEDPSEESKSEEKSVEAESESSVPKTPSIPITLHSTAHSGFNELMSTSCAYHLIFDMKGDTLIKLSLGTIALKKSSELSKSSGGKKSKKKKKKAPIIDPTKVVARDMKASVKLITPFHQLFFESKNIRARLGCVVWKDTIIIVLWAPPLKKWSVKKKVKVKKESQNYHAAAAQRLVDEFGSISGVSDQIITFKKSKISLNDYLDQIKAHIPDEDE